MVRARFQKQPAENKCSPKNEAENREARFTQHSKNKHNGQYFRFKVVCGKKYDHTFVHGE